MIANFWAWSKRSLVHLVANITVVLSFVYSMLLQFADNIGDLVGDPNFQTQVQSVLSPKVVPWVLIGIMITVKLARDRSMPHAAFTRKLGATFTSRRYTLGQTPAVRSTIEGDRGWLITFVGWLVAFAGIITGAILR